MKQLLMIAAGAAFVIAGCGQSEAQVTKTETPAAEQQSTDKDKNVSDAKMQTFELKVDGMMCENCVKHVTDILAAQEGVNDVNVDLKSGKAIVHTKPGAKFDDAKAADALDVDNYKVTACVEVTD
jgi:copper chaperone CopZ